MILTCGDRSANLQVDTKVLAMNVIDGLATPLLPGEIGEEWMDGRPESRNCYLSFYKQLENLIL